MCLDNVGELKTALEDVVVFKRLEPARRIQDVEQYHGKPFIGVINDVAVHGKITVEAECMFFCTDFGIANGAQCNNRHEFKYSWRLDAAVDLESLKIEGEKMFKVANYQTPYRNFLITLGEKYESQLVKDEWDEVDLGIHSFTTLEDAKDDGFGVVVQCIIPTGSNYYEGEFCGKSSIASDTIIYGTETVKTRSC